MPYIIVVLHFTYTLAYIVEYIVAIVILKKTLLSVRTFKNKKSKVKVFILPSLTHSSVLFLSICRSEFQTSITFLFSEEVVFVFFFKHFLLGRSVGTNSLKSKSCHGGCRCLEAVESDRPRFS